MKMRCVIFSVPGKCNSRFEQVLSRNEKGQNDTQRVDNYKIMNAFAIVIVRLATVKLYHENITNETFSLSHAHMNQFPTHALLDYNCNHLFTCS